MNKLDRNNKCTKQTNKLQTKSNQQQLGTKQNANKQARGKKMQNTYK